jgi:site-specific DNA recombinase
MQRCVIHCRVSTDAQERDGTSLDTQQQECRAFALNAGWTVIDCISDTASGFSLERPGLDRVRRLVREGAVDVVLCFALDRLSRKQTHVAILVEEAEDYGVKLAFVTECFEDTATGQLLRSVKAFAAELEREKISERTMRGKAQRARAGKIPQATGRGLYGYQYDPATGHRTIDPEQARVVQRIFRAFHEGGSCHGIAVTLNAEDITTLAGSHWHPLTIRRMLGNESYTGTTIYRRTLVEQVRDPRTGKKQRKVTVRNEADWIPIVGATPALISHEVFGRVQAILDDPDRRLRGQPSRQYRLRGYVRCLACGTPMVGQTLMRGRYAYYRCRRSYGVQTDGTCRSRYIAAERLESIVLDEIVKVLADPARVIAEAERLAGTTQDDGRMGEVRRRLEDVEGQQRRLARLYTEGKLPEHILSDESSRLTAERNRLERERAELALTVRPLVDANRIRAALPQVLALVRRYVVEAQDDELNLLLRALDIQVRASAQRVEIAGAVPVVPTTEPEGNGQDLVTIARTSA